MRKNAADYKISQEQVSSSDFLKSYNKNIPATFPKATVVLMNKFKDNHIMLFKHGDLWSLDQHLKKMMDWLPRNSKTS